MSPRPRHYSYGLDSASSLSYDGLEIQEGGTASLEFCRVTFGNGSEAEKARVRRNLEVYCTQDTMGMVKILRAHHGVSGA